MATTIYYLCDRRACEKCNPDCTHTSDIRHAKNFRVVGDAIFELNPPAFTTETPRDPHIACVKVEPLPATPPPPRAQPTKTD